MVTICTTSLTFNNSTFCPHTVFMYFVWISEQTAIISLYSINRLVCITQTQCVYCAVRTKYLNTVPVPDTVTRFSPCTPVPPQFHQTSIHIFIYTLLFPGRNGGFNDPSIKLMLLLKLGSIRWKNTFIFPSLKG